MSITFPDKDPDIIAALTHGDDDVSDRVILEAHERAMRTQEPAHVRESVFVLLARSPYLR